MRYAKLKGACSALSLSDISYILRRSDTGQLINFFSQLRSFLDIAPLGNGEVDQALRSKFTDFEDALQWQAASSWKATHFITRNISDFPRSKKLKVQTPAAYCAATNL